jgi:NAD(P)H-dependent FMN reductase
MPSTIALFASSRRHGNTGRLIDQVAEELRIEVVDLGALRLSAFDYGHRNRDDDFEPLIARVLDFDQLIFASPVYWYSVSPPMKVFLDRLSDLLDIEELLPQGRRLRGKTAFVACTSIVDEVAPPFIGAFRDTFEYLGMRYGGLLNANCQDGYEAAKYQPELRRFIARVRGGAQPAATAGN